MIIKKNTIGVIYGATKEQDEKRIRYCSRCESLHVKAVLKPRVLMVNEVKPADFDHYLACTNCGTVYPKTETKIEPEISTIKEPSDGKPSRVWAVEGKKGRKRGTGREKISNSRRVRTSSWELSDQDLQNELKSGGVLLAYSSSDPII